MAITYRTVLKQAINGFNGIQNTLNNLNGSNNKGTYSIIKALSQETTNNITTVSNAATPEQLAGAIEKLAIIYRGGDSFVTGKINYYSGNETVETSTNGGSISFSYTIPAGYHAERTISGSTSLTTGNASITPSLTTSLKLGLTAKDSILLNNAPDSGEYYTLTLDPNASITEFNAGYFGSRSNILIKDGANIVKYIPKLSGGGLSGAGDVGISISEVADTDTDGTNHNIDLSTVSVSGTKGTYYFRVKAGGTTKTVKRAKLDPGYTEGIDESSVSVTAADKYTFVNINKASGTTTNGSVTQAKATAAIRKEHGDLINNTAGISTERPESSKVEGTDYWVIEPYISSTTNGSVSAASFKVSGAGYLIKNTTFNASGSTSVGVTGSVGSIYYINKASGGGLSGAGDVGISTSKVADTDTDGSLHNVDLSDVSVDSTKGTGKYYFRVKAAGSSKTVTRASVSAGYTTGLSQTTASVTANTKYSYINIKSGTLGTCEKAAAVNSNGTFKGYKDLSGESYIIPSEGYLILNSGYYPNSKISLDSLLGGQEDNATLINAGYLRKGYKAYNEDGKLIDGAMLDVNPTFTISVTNGEANSSTTITSNTSSPSNKGAAINYDNNKLGGSSEASYYVTVSATGSGGASAPTASSKYANGYTGYLSKSSGTAAGSGSGSAVSKTSSDTNYIPAHAGGSITGNAASYTTSATITATTTSPANKGAVINYNDNKLGGDAEADYYVTVSATSNGSATAGSNKSIEVKDKYMLSNLSVSAPAPTKTSSGGDTNYIPAHPGGSVTGNTASFTTSTTITANTSSSPSNKGVAKNYNDNKLGGSSEAAYYVTISATSNGTGSAGSNKSIEVKDKYMLSNLSVSTPAPTKTSSGSDTNYIKANNESSGSTGAGTVSGSVNSPSVGSATTFTLTTNSSTGVVSAISMTAGGKTATTSATISTNNAGSSKTYSIKDTYCLNNITVSATKSSVSISSGTATINTNATGSSVDTYLDALYKRINGLTYTDVSAD